jgi:SAM-dependent methyltransferase
MKYDEDYFEHGKSKGISNYEGYSKTEAKTVVVVNDLVREFKLGGQRVLDYGCATGYHVRELRLRGVDAWGTDISDYAINEAMENNPMFNFIHYYNKNLLTNHWDYILFLDVLEHMEGEELISVMNLMKKGETKKIIVKIPICAKEGKKFVFEVSRKDKTHIMCKSKFWWKSLFKQFGYKKFEPIDTTYLFDSEGVLAGVFS